MSNSHHPEKKHIEITLDDYYHLSNLYNEVCTYTKKLVKKYRSLQTKYDVLFKDYKIAVRLLKQSTVNNSNYYSNQNDTLNDNYTEHKQIPRRTVGPKKESRKNNVKFTPIIDAVPVTHSFKNMSVRTEMNKNNHRRFKRQYYKGKVNKKLKEIFNRKGFSL